MPAGAQLSDDGHYWWDGNQWQPVVSPQSGGQSGGAQVGTRSADGHYWWDGSQWQPIDQSMSGGQSVAGGEGQQMDWAQFPEIARALQYGDEVDTYLRDLGVDPDIMCDDEPFANA